MNRFLMKKDLTTHNVKDNRIFVVPNGDDVLVPFENEPKRYIPIGGSSVPNTKYYRKAIICCDLLVGKSERQVAVVE